MADKDITALPAGFTRVAPAPQAADPNALPEGFTRTVPDNNPYGSGDLGVVGNIERSAGDLGSALDNTARRVANGFTAGWADHLAARANAGINNNIGPSALTANDTVAGQQAQSAQAKTELGPVVSTAADMAGAGAQMAMLPGSAVSSLPRAMVTGGGLNAANTQAQSFADTGKPASAFQTALSTGVGIVTGAAGHELSSVFQRPRLDATRTEHVDTLRQAGVPVTAGQATGNSGYLAREGSANGSQEFIDQQAKAFSSAAADHANVPTVDGRVSADALDSAMRTTTNQMDALASRNTVAPQDLASAWPVMRTAMRDFGQSIEPPAQALRRTMDHVVTAANRPGGMTGTQWQTISSELGSIASDNAGSAYGRAAHAMRRALGDAMESSIGRTNPADVGAWQSVNQQYARQLVIKDAITGAAAGGKGAALDLVTPANLRQAALGVDGANSFARNGTSSWRPLANAGVAMVKPLPKSNPLQGIREAVTMGGLGGASYAMGAPSAVSGALAGAGALRAGTSAARDATGLALRDVNSLSPTANAFGAAAGNATGNTMSPQHAFNPFLKAMGL